MSVGDIWKFIVVGTVSGQRQENVLYYRTTVERSTSSDDLPALVLIASETLAPLYAPVTPDNYTLEEIQIRGVTLPTQGQDVVIDQTGDKLGELLPLTNTAVLSLKTAKIGRSYRGRIYMPVVTESDQQGGNWESAYLNQLGTFGAGIITIQPVSPGTYTAELVVYSRKLLVATTVTAIAPNPVVATQRRRRQGVGI